MPLPIQNVNSKTLNGLCWLAALGLLGVAAGLAGKPAGQAKSSRSDSELITIVVKDAHPIGPISPLIYGMAMPSPEHIKQAGVPLVRWGGNQNTRYNWELGNAWNAARDWRFANVNYVGPGRAQALPSGAADSGIAAARSQGAQFFLTVPTMGWVARDNDTSHASQSVPAAGGMPVSPGSEAIAGYDPAANRQRVSVRSLPRKGRPFADPPDKTDAVVYQDEWVAHLVHTFGRAEAGGVRFYAMDNEPDLWDTTHTDMHPVAPDYDELLHQFLTTADAIKDVDPTAQITGPVSWGWSGYFFSPRDRGSDAYATHADRQAHANQPFLPWFLQQVARHDRLTGRRSLDVLDVHFYPQSAGVYAGQTDPATNTLRLRSARALWDSSYQDESWIAAPVQLVPRLRQWVRQNYPGTKIGLTEWNWGAENTLNGGLAVAEVLGILGREQVDLACYWTCPPLNSPAFFAYKMYRSPDGTGRGFGDIALPARSDAPDVVSCYAACESRTRTLTLMLINKAVEARTVTVKAETGFGIRSGIQDARKPTPPSGSATAPTGRRRARTFRYEGSHLQNIASLPDTILEPEGVRLTLPPASLTLLKEDTKTP